MSNTISPQPGMSEFTAKQKTRQQTTYL